MKTIIANWKMHLGIRESIAHARGVLRAIMGNDVLPEIVVCPSFTALSEVRKVLVRTHVQLGAQTMGPERFGAFTGEVSVAQLDDAGCLFVILGHSERRMMAGETDATVNTKMKLITQTSLVPVLCVGESRDVRKAGDAETFVARQLADALRNVRIAKSARLIVAYEPLWAIGSGESATPADAVAMHTMIREIVTKTIGVKNESLSVLYGGSVNGANAYQFLREPAIDGVLVGGASLKLQEFEAILTAGRDVMVAQNV
ncbi:MAG: triose-phosphate isomerase [Patescibacteria group bacterium]